MLDRNDLLDQLDRKNEKGLPPHQAYQVDPSYQALFFFLNKGCLITIIRVLDMNDLLDQLDRKNEKDLLHNELTRTILGCCFEVMNELGPGFLESLYKNALLLAIREKNLQIEIEKSLEVVFRDKVIGRYRADLVVENKIIVELKCCECLIPEHQAQVFNYLRVSQLPIGLLINFRYRKLEYQRLHQP